MSKKINIAINGFGRIGRLVMRCFAPYSDKINLVAINSPGNAQTSAHLFQYDSVHGRYANPVQYGENWLDFGFGKVHYSQIKTPADIGWDKLGVDIVLECSGKFNERDKAMEHIKGGAKRVLVSAPCKNADKTIVYGVNHGKITAGDVIISSASCTTNCLAPVVRVLLDNFGIDSGFMTTIHAYTGDQNIVDSSHKDLRRARAAALSMIPTTTGAAKSLGEVIPEVKGKLDGSSIRVPTPNVSVVDLTIKTPRDTSVDEVNKAFINAQNGGLKGILTTTNEPLVSSDFIGMRESACVDLSESFVLNKNMVRVMAWYDNEIGFSYRMLDNILVMGAL